MIELCSTKCCGVMEINNLSKVKSPLAALKAIAQTLKQGFDPKNWGQHPPVFVTFTGVTKRVWADHTSDRADNYGQAFSDFLTKHKLGPVVSSEERVNWTANSIKLWVWHPDYARLWKFLEKD